MLPLASSVAVSLQEKIQSYEDAQVEAVGNSLREGVRWQVSSAALKHNKALPKGSGRTRLGRQFFGRTEDVWLAQVGVLQPAFPPRQSNETVTWKQ